MLKYTLIFCGLLTAYSFAAAPQPAVVPAENHWMLNVVYTQPQQITVRLPNVRKPQRFWYIIITVSNNSQIDVPFYPLCELMTDTYQIIPAYRDSRNLVFDKIKARHKRKYPFLESLESAENRILQGQDNSKDMAIIWPDFDPQAKNISLFIAGLSNEIAVVEHPIDKDANGIPQKLYLRKSLALHYSIGGDSSLRQNSGLLFNAKEWVMR